MRILICHAYFLEGSPGDLYIQSVARALCRAGHQLVVMCQEDDPKYDFASTLLLEQIGGINPHVAWDRETDYKGSCMIYRADVGKLLPVYEMDSYPGFEVKEYRDLTGNEIEDYVNGYRRVITRLVDQFIPEVILVNHALILPYAVHPIAESNEVPYFVICGSEELGDKVFEEERFRVFAVGGIVGSKGVFVDSLSAKSAAEELLGDKAASFQGDIHCIPPGVEVGPVTLGTAPFVETVNIILKAVESRMSRITIGDFLQLKAREKGATDSDSTIAARVEEIGARHPEGLPDADIARKFDLVTGRDRPFVMYAGELNEEGGLQFILPALPFIVEEQPDACLLICGSGNLRGLLELMIEAIGAGDIEALKELCRYGNDNSRYLDEPFTKVLTFLDQLESDGLITMYEQLCKGLVIGTTAVFCGHLFHEEYLDILPFARGLLVPCLDPASARISVLEAMAAGVIPAALRIPELEDILGTVEQEWGDGMLLGMGEDIVSRTAQACRAMLKAPEERVAAWGRQAIDITAAKYSWDSAAQHIAGYFESVVRD